MSLITISIQFLGRYFPYQRMRLLLSYLVTMVAIIGTLETSLYFFLIHSLNQQFDRELLTLVKVATPTLDKVKTQGRESLDKAIPWRTLFSHQDQSLEWFDSDGKLLAQEGNPLQHFPLSKNIKPLNTNLDSDFPVFQQKGGMRAVTIPVYAQTPENDEPKLEGYIRATESTDNLEITLRKLRLGLGLGGSTTLIFISLSSIYLTQEALKPLKQGFNRLKQIVAAISHQLRTPLTRITLATEILLTHQERMQASDARKITIINSAVEQLKRLVEDSLFLLRADAIYIDTELRLSNIALNEILEPLRVKFESLAENKGISFQLNLPDNINVKGDAAQLNRLFTNLLENALNYTHPGGNISVSAKKTRDEVVISIEDTGMGIAFQSIPLIFQGFWRGEEAQNIQQDGLGLGLTIAQAIAHQHNGEITVRSQIGQGSCFQLHLPLK